jgi:LemA protein
MVIFWILLIAAVWAVWVFNGLIVLRNRVDESASDIDVQLKRRHDLVPNLVSTVKGYATHEDQLFTRVTEARASAVAAGADLKNRAQAENMLTDSLRSLFAVAENYPALQANQNFLSLQAELSATEDKIMSSRRFYNANVRDYNIRRETFPTSLLANYFKFGKRELFELEDISEKAVPQVDFSGSAVPAAPMAEHTQAPAMPAEPVDMAMSEPAESTETYDSTSSEPTTDQEESDNSNRQG